MQTNPPRGMRDFYPEDMTVRNTVFNAWSNSSLSHGFSQYDACVVESLNLLQRKAGEEISEQIYTFKDKSGRDLLLRPEMTPTLARMIASRYNTLQFPLKWFSISQCFRYERTTKGRKREHYQWNLDIVGEKNVSAEAEILSTAVQAMSLLGFTAKDYQIRLNSRAILSDLMTSLGIPQKHHGTAFLILDKRGKISDEEIETKLTENDVTPDQIKRIMSFISISSLEETEKLLKPDNPNLLSIKELFSMLASYGIDDCITFDLSVVRGLNYYTGIVFEAYDINRKFRAIFGGGRYDNLLETIGGHNETAVGLGFGDVVINEILSERKIDTAITSPNYMVGYMDKAQFATAVTISEKLRKYGHTVDMSLKPERAKNFFSRANRKSAEKAVYLGPDDLTKGTVKIKDLSERTETEIPIDKIG